MPRTTGPAPFEHPSPLCIPASTPVSPPSRSRSVLEFQIFPLHPTSPSASAARRCSSSDPHTSRAPPTHAPPLSPPPNPPPSHESKAPEPPPQPAPRPFPPAHSQRFAGPPPYSKHSRTTTRSPVRRPPIAQASIRYLRRTVSDSYHPPMSILPPALAVPVAPASRWRFSVASSSVSTCPLRSRSFERTATNKPKTLGRRLCR